MKKLSRIAALLAASAMLFGAVSCSDGSSSGSGEGGDPTPEPTGTEYKWSFAATDLLGNLAWSADSAQNNTAAPSGTEYAKVKLDAAGSYESTPAGLTMNLAAGSQFNKVSPSSSPSSSVTTGASNGFVEPLAGTVLSVSVKGPFTVKANVGANSSSDKTDRYAFIKVGDDEVAAPNKTTTTLPAAGQVLSYTYEGTETVVVSVGGSGITRVYDVIITTANGDAGTKTAGEVISLGAFASATDDSTANDEATLGLVGTEVSSSAEAVATAAIEGGKIIITSVSAGSAVISVKDAESNAATIAVSVNATGAIAIGKITKYVAASDSSTGVWDLKSRTAAPESANSWDGSTALSADVVLAADSGTGTVTVLSGVKAKYNSGLQFSNGSSAKNLFNIDGTGSVTIEYNAPSDATEAKPFVLYAEGDEDNKITATSGKPAGSYTVTISGNTKIYSNDCRILTITFGAN